MIKCLICAYHHQTNKKHTCDICRNKIVYGILQEPFLEYCQMLITPQEVKRRQLVKNYNNRPYNDIDVRTKGGGND